MDFLHAFPIAIIDEDFDAKTAAGRGMRQLSQAIEKEGFRVVSGLSYDDAERLAQVFNSESCWLISVDGAERSPKQWQLTGHRRTRAGAMSYAPAASRCCSSIAR